MAQPLDNPLPSADRPAIGPTPEEISARLEALLARTQALRRAQPDMSAAGPMPWPPSVGELDGFDMVDVPDDRTSPTTEAVPQFAPEQAAAPAVRRIDATSQSLREPGPALPHAPRWLWLLVAALAAALLVETAYLVRTAPWAATEASSLVRLDGDPRVTARIDDGEPQALPFDTTIAGGHTAIVTLHLADLASVQPTAASSTGAPASGGDTRTTRDPSRGSVLIESTPPGAAIVMEGRPRGVTPLRIDDLRPGRHDVLVSIGGRRHALNVAVAAGETTRLDATRP
jgi:hypothetical protein